MEELGLPVFNYTGCKTVTNEGVVAKQQNKGHTGHVLSKKFKNMKIKIKEWAMNKYGLLEHRIHKWEEELLNLEFKEEDEILTF